MKETPVSLTRRGHRGIGTIICGASKDIARKFPKLDMAEATTSILKPTCA